MPRIIGSNLKDHRAKMRDRIFTSFATLLSERGYAAITLADIAAGSGIGRSAMYNYYPDKEALLLDYTAEETEYYLERLNEELALVTNSIEKLELYIRMQLIELSEQHISIGSMSGVLSENGRLEIRKHVAPLIDILRDILNSAIEEGYIPDGDIEPRLALVSSTVNGRVVTELPGDKLERAIELTTRFVLRGLQVELDDSHQPVLIR